MEQIIPTFIDNIPLHPLLVHAAVVLLPLAAAATIALIFFPSLRTLSNKILLLGFSILGTLSTALAKETGELLSIELGYPNEHASLGENAYLASLLFTIILFTWLILDLERLSHVKFIKIFRNIASAVLSVSSTLLVVSVFLAGHSGAATTWENRLGSTETESSNSAITVPGSNLEIQKSDTNYSLAITSDIIAEYFNKPEHCWTTIDGEVYNLSAYISEHPGGSSRILELCGIDGTSYFTEQHGNDRIAISTLSKFAVAELDQEINLKDYDVPANLIKALGLDSNTYVPVSPDASDDTSTDSGSAQSDSEIPTQPVSDLILDTNEVAKHSTASDCWTVINNKVYNLTSYISRHPGGSSVIKSICGVDGTSNFTGQHSLLRGSPISVLNGFLIGTIGDSVSSVNPTTPPIVKDGTQGDYYDDEDEDYEDEEEDED